MLTQSLPSLPVISDGAGEETSAPVGLDALAHDALLAIARALDDDEDALALAGACRATRDAMGEAGELRVRRAVAERRLHDRWCVTRGEGESQARGGGARWVGGGWHTCEPLGESCGCGAWEAHKGGCTWLTALRCGAQARFDAPLGRGALRVLLHLLRAGGGGEPEGGSVRLARLVLDSSGIDSKDAATLAKRLPSVAPHLTSLSLSACEIGDVGAQALAAAIAAGAWPKLTGVDVDENPFGGTGRAALRRACRARGVSVSVSSAIENESLFE